MKRRSLPGRRESRRLGVVVYCLCAVYLHVITALLSWTLLPAAGGWSPTLIVSDSMTPRISAGDVVLLGNLPPDGARRGSVITFDDTARQGRLLTHRVVRRNADGTYTTRGDANRSADSTPVQSKAIRGVGRVLVPAVGAPAVWVREGNWTALLLWLGGSGIAFWYLRSFGRGRPSVWGWSAPLDALPAGPEKRSAPAIVVPPRGWEPPRRPVRRTRWATPTLLAIVALVAAALPSALASEGAFSSATQNSDNSFSASASFCTAQMQTVVASADAKVVQNQGTTNFGTTTDLFIDPRGTRLARSYIAFTLPSKPTACTVTATLRVYVTAWSTSVRTIEALQVSGAWNEGTITYNTAPAGTGTAATASSLTAAGWMTFDVSAQVATMYSGSNHGFVLKDSAEGVGGNNPQTFTSRDPATGQPPAVNAPELVVTFAP